MNSSAFFFEALNNLLGAIFSNRKKFFGSMTVLLQNLRKLCWEFPTGLPETPYHILICHFYFSLIRFAGWYGWTVKKLVPWPGFVPNLLIILVPINTRSLRSPLIMDQRSILKCGVCCTPALSIPQYALFLSGRWWKCRRPPSSLPHSSP